MNVKTWFQGTKLVACSSVKPKNLFLMMSLKTPGLKNILIVKCKAFTQKPTKRVKLSEISGQVELLLLNSQPFQTFQTILCLKKDVILGIATPKEGMRTDMKIEVQCQ
jgi:hypothetical protein